VADVAERHGIRPMATQAGGLKPYTRWLIAVRAIRMLPTFAGFWELAKKRLVAHVLRKRRGMLER
jgi:hypothetical protein